MSAYAVQNFRDHYLGCVLLTLSKEALQEIEKHDYNITVIRNKTEALLELKTSLEQCLDIVNKELKK